MSFSLPSFDESPGWGATPSTETGDDIVTAAIKKEKTIQYVCFLEATDCGFRRFTHREIAAAQEDLKGERK
jgi:hypothetical protein